uniref:Uncharacterized protein n=1 Tax=Arundo donax TaxID=35708 RepID=A0A0A9D4Z1_ARUDO
MRRYDFFKAFFIYWRHGQANTNFVHSLFYSIHVSFHVTKAVSIIVQLFIFKIIFYSFQEHITITNKLFSALGI